MFVTVLVEQDWDGQGLLPAVKVECGTDKAGTTVTLGHDSEESIQVALVMLRPVMPDL